MRRRSCAEIMLGFYLLVMVAVCVSWSNRVAVAVDVTLSNRVSVAVDVT